MNKKVYLNKWRWFEQFLSQSIGIPLYTTFRCNLLHHFKLKFLAGRVCLQVLDKLKKMVVSLLVLFDYKMEDFFMIKKISFWQDRWKQHLLTDIRFKIIPVSLNKQTSKFTQFRQIGESCSSKHQSWDSFFAFIKAFPTHVTRVALISKSSCSFLM